VQQQRSELRGRDPSVRPAAGGLTAGRTPADCQQTGRGERNEIAHTDDLDDLDSHCDVDRVNPPCRLLRGEIDLRLGKLPVAAAIAKWMPATASPPSAPP